ncbi:MAG: GNAT family N-acetyltransferase, partial [Candidatus Sumerlaeota bacterium]|nr:GNAT family N-acetyltransferase [Candidatus Sumerlaeota bacterium]
MTPSPDLRYDTLREDDLSGFVDILGQAFHMPAERTRQAIEQAGLDAHRIIRRGGALAGGLRLILMGQWFGGACVPMAGVASVAVAPEHRRGGAATALMRSALEEMRDRRIPISVLYPTLASFYRKAGYEFAGVKISYEAPLTALDAGERDLAVTRVGPADRETLRALYDRRAQASAGNLDRPAYLWSRLLEPINQTAYAYLVGDAGKPDGYAIFTQEGWSKPIRASDVCVRSRAAALRLLTFFSDHRTTVSALEWTGGPEDALLHTLPEYSKKEARIWLWML